MYLPGSQLTHNILGSNSNDMFIEASLSMTSKPSPSTVSTEINISQIFGEFPENCFSEDQKQCLSVLEVAYKHLPMPMDSQRHRYVIFLHVLERKIFGCFESYIILSLTIINFVCLIICSTFFNFGFYLICIFVSNHSVLKLYQFTLYC